MPGAGLLLILLAAVFVLSPGISRAEDGDDWICPECGRENDTRFCVYCGYARPVTVVCPVCGAIYMNNPDIRFCGDCGTRLREDDDSRTELPESPITLITPDMTRSTVSTTMATIRIMVIPGSRVTVNGTDVSDTVDKATGEMVYNVMVQPIGDNVFDIAVLSDNCRENVLRVIIYREPQEIPLDLAAGTYGVTDRNTMKVTATTIPGASVEITTPYTNLDISGLNTTGKFTFEAVFEHIGDNTVTVMAYYPGKKPSRIDHFVYYVPPADEYTRKAWALDAANYSDLLNTIEARSSRQQVYAVSGVVQYIVSDKPQMVVINTGEDGKSQPVLLENRGTVSWEAGQYYRIYADAYGTYNSMPYLIARYTYTE